MAKLIPTITFKRDKINIAIDDDMSQTYLAAKHFIDVRDIPSDGEFKSWFDLMVGSMHHVEEMRRRVAK